jgi:hypothetical protein
MEPGGVRYHGQAGRLSGTRGEPFRSRHIRSKPVVAGEIYDRVIGGSVFSKKFASCYKRGAPRRNLNAASGGYPASANAKNRFDSACHQATDAPTVHTVGQCSLLWPNIESCWTGAERPEVCVSDLESSQQATPRPPGALGVLKHYPARDDAQAMLERLERWRPAPDPPKP